MTGSMIIKSFVLIHENGRFLLIREAAKKWRGKWFLPGGKIFINESPTEAAIREVKEEAGCDVLLKGIFYIRYHERLFNKQLSLFYHAKISGGKIKTKADKHSLEVKWFTDDQIKSLPMRQKLMEIIKSFKAGNSMLPDNFKFYV